MKAFPLKKKLYTTLTLLFMVVLLGMPISYADDGSSGKKSGFEQGKHEGHTNEKGKHKGFENEKNPWYRRYQQTGVNFDLLIHHHGLIPMTVFTTPVNSLMTIDEFLTDILGDASEGFQLQECYEEGGMLLMVSSDCTAGETTEVLNSNLTLEAAGILDDPEVHLVYIPG